MRTNNRAHLGPVTSVRMMIVSCQLLVPFSQELSVRAYKCPGRGHSGEVQATWKVVGCYHCGHRHTAVGTPTLHPPAGSCSTTAQLMLVLLTAPLPGPLHFREFWEMQFQFMHGYFKSSLQDNYRVCHPKQAISESEMDSKMFPQDTSCKSRRCSPWHFPHCFYFPPGKQVLSGNFVRRAEQVDFLVLEVEVLKGDWRSHPRSL